MVRVEKLARRYGRRWALAEVSFELGAGKALMVAGRNGSGKSTLFRVLATAIRPDRGTATIDGFDVATQREDVRKRTAILSHASYLYETLTARENLEVVADHLRVPRANATPLLGRVGLAQRGNDPVSTFSAGMRRRLAFARVLLQEPRVVFLDEPYAQLDPEGFDLVDEVVGELRARGTTILIATHQLERTARACDYAMTLEGGRIAEWKALA